jgi:uncharacterized membrane protein YhhN
MYKKFNQLSFVIGLFFFLVALILFIHILLSRTTGKINIYTAVVFLIFGIGMMLAKDSEKNKPEGKL